MICPKCGSEAEGKFCSNCGVPLAEEDEHKTDDWFQGGNRAGDGEKQPQPSDEGKQEKREEPAGERRSRKKPEKTRGREKAASKTRKSPDKKAGRKADKAKEERIKKLEERLKRWEKEGEVRKKREGEKKEESSEGIKDAAAKTAAGIILLIARILQLLCFALMAGMTGLAAWSFYENRTFFGDLTEAAAARNYGLAAYGGMAAAVIVTGILWSLWVLSKKAAGGGIRMKSYDTGRGFIPFILCVLCLVGTGAAAGYFSELESLFAGRPEIAQGIETFIKAVNQYHETFMTFASAGAVMSLIRKLLRV